MTHDKDILEKKLEDYNDVFADIINGLLPLDEKIAPEDLQDVRTRNVYSSSGEIHEQERDTVKLWTKGGIIFCLLVLENQSTIDKAMPVRVAGYEGGDYRVQITRRDDDIKAAKKAEDSEEVKRLLNTKFYPVVTIVLYYGMRCWKKPRTLFECLDIPKSFRPFVNDAKLNIIEIAWLTDEQAAKFTSDFRIVVDYFRQKRITKNYKASKWEIEHVDSLLKLMRALTGDKTFEYAQNRILYDYEKGDKVTMDNFLSRQLAKGEAKGRREGRREGIAKGLLDGKAEASRNIYQKLLEMGFSPELASQATGITE